MKILFITHYFQPEPNFFFGLPLAREFVKRGHEVQVITGFPNYPGGRIYDGYKGKLFMRENMEGVEVLRFPLYPSHDQSAVKRILCYLSLSTSMSLFAPFIIKKADIAYVIQGPATLGLPAVILKWFRNIPFVYNIQDVWPDSLLSTGMFKNGFAYKMLHSWCKFNYRNASKNVVISQGMKSLLLDRGVPRNKIEIIYNWCDAIISESKVANRNVADKLGFTGKFNVVFAGNMGGAQALSSVIKAAEIVQRNAPDVQFVMIGSGVEFEPLKKQVKESRLKNVIFHGRKPVEEIGGILKLADVLLVHLRKDPLFEITIPSKTQAYLSLGRPILMCVEGNCADIVKDAGAGFCCEPENPEEIAKEVIKLSKASPKQLCTIGKKGKKYYDDKMSLSTAVDNLEEMFFSVQGKNGEYRKA
ncbi:putative glycosyl transferase [Sedimentisphaera cyanobacteriorum]|uniref:Putative glycosyl transferase n=1 Tax=Sedimentisphaera cyanobacteriorum TaxID=1940790 RepID=A0A1Q2HP87_9BACT|nr:glycosyltransferase family 4 protein [Sedimentisphaera cyanobacteriorum]AQQ09151.1 putative glycosyl transferase [Sedimentisphaera cyanobacteriorum]